MSKYQPSKLGLVLIPFIIFALLPGVLTVLILLLAGFICGVPRVSKWVEPYIEDIKRR